MANHAFDSLGRPDLMFNALDRPPNAVANRLAAVRSGAILLRQGVCARWPAGRRRGPRVGRRAPLETARATACEFASHLRHSGSRQRVGQTVPLGKSGGSSGCSEPGLWSPLQRLAQESAQNEPESQL